MKLFLLLSAVLTSCVAGAQSNPEPTIAQPAQTVASPDAGINDKPASESKEPYRIETEKNAKRLEQIKVRTATHQKKQIKKYKGKKADTTQTKQ